jgi:hypothetical protein
VASACLFCDLSLFDSGVRQRTVSTFYFTPHQFNDISSKNSAHLHKLFTILGIFRLTSTRLDEVLLYILLRCSPLRRNLLQNFYESAYWSSDFESHLSKGGPFHVTCH